MRSRGPIRVAANAIASNLVVALPKLNLAYNQAGQSFVIPVANSGSAMALNGVQLELIVGDGDVSVGGSGGAPAITSVNLVQLWLALCRQQHRRPWRWVTSPDCARCLSG